jgi:hypothetical protein
MAREASIARTSNGGGGEQGGVRLLAVLFLLVVALLSVVALLTSLALVDPQQFRVGEWQLAPALTGWITGLQGLERLGFAAGSFVVALLACWGLWAQLRGAGGSKAAAPSRYLLVADDQGFVLVETASVGAIANQAAQQAPGVVDSNVEVRGGAAGPVRLRVQLAVHPGADVKATGNQARDEVHKAVEQLVGLEVRDVTVDVRVVEADELAKVLL